MKKKGKKLKKFPLPATQLIGSYWCTKGGGHPRVLDFCHRNTQSYVPVLVFHILKAPVTPIPPLSTGKASMYLY